MCSRVLCDCVRHSLVVANALNLVEQNPLCTSVHPSGTSVVKFPAITMTSKLQDHFNHRGQGVMHRGTQNFFVGQGHIVFACIFMTMFDLIGDIHGHAAPLKKLLGKMDYKETASHISGL